MKEACVFAVSENSTRQYYKEDKKGVTLEMSILILIPCALICLFFLNRLFNSEESSPYFHWGLSGDVSYYYSPDFFANQPSIRIIGYQQALDKNKAIHYTIVQINRFGKRTVHGTGFICGDYTHGHPFELSFDHIPSGEKYKIEIFSGFNMSYGKFKIIQD
jgi:hypothetical protein